MQVHNVCWSHWIAVFTIHNQSQVARFSAVFDWSELGIEIIAVIHKKLDDLSLNVCEERSGGVDSVEHSRNVGRSPNTNQTSGEKKSRLARHLRVETG